MHKGVQELIDKWGRMWVMEYKVEKLLFAFVKNRKVQLRGFGINAEIIFLNGRAGVRVQRAYYYCYFSAFMKQSRPCGSSSLLSVQYDHG